MTQAAWMLEVDSAGWQLHASRGAEHAPVASGEFASGELLAQVEAMAAAFSGGGYTGEPIVVALGSSWCLAATLSIERPSELRDRTTMRYRLEEWIPWGAEEFVADFAAANGAVLAVAARSEPLVELLRLLEIRGILVQCVVPLAILAGAEHIQSDTWPNCHAVAIAHMGAIDLLHFEGSTITQWQSFSTNGLSLCHELRRQALETGQTVNLVAYDLDRQWSDDPSETEFVECMSLTDDSAPRSAMDLAMSAAAKLVGGVLEIPIDLQREAAGRRRGNLALRRYAMALQTAVAAVLVASIVTLGYRAHLAGRQSLAVTAQQAGVFHAVFPNAKVPVGVATRLRSELAKLQGLRGDDASLPERMSAIVVLERMLKAVPTDKRFRLLEIRMEEGRLYLDGETRVHSDAESIAQRLRAEEFTVSPPKSQRLDDQRVSLRITGTLSGENLNAARK